VNNRNLVTVRDPRSGRNIQAQYAFGSHPGWNHDHVYVLDGHHYRWFDDDDAWFIIDPFPYYAGYPYYGGYYGGGYYGYSSNPGVVTQVQQDLANAGYYQGAIDGIMGPETRSAIAAYQSDNGLPVTGTITRNLMASLQ
jgi:hypothetical protein